MRRSATLAGCAPLPLPSLASRRLPTLAGCAPLPLPSLASRRLPTLTRSAPLPLPGAAPGTRVLVRRPAAPDRGIIRRLLESRLLRLGTATGGNEQ